MLVPSMIKAIPIALLIAVLVVIFLIIKHNSANKQPSATNYLSQDGYDIIDKQNTFVRTYETVQQNYYKPKSSNDGGNRSA